MEQEDLDQLKVHLEEVIQKTVNGKIDKLAAQFMKHSEEMKPILEAYQATNTLGKFLAWASKMALSVGIIIGSIVGFFRFFINK